MFHARCGLQDSVICKAERVAFRSSSSIRKARIARAGGLRRSPHGTAGLWIRQAGARAMAAPTCPSSLPTLRIGQPHATDPTPGGARAGSVRLVPFGIAGLRVRQDAGTMAAPPRPGSHPAPRIGQPHATNPTPDGGPSTGPAIRTAGILRLPARNARASHLPKSTAGTAAPNLCRGRCASFGLDLTLSQRKPGP